jgi:hypothetical protein
MDFGRYGAFSSSDVPEMVDQQISWNSLVIRSNLLYLEWNVGMLAVNICILWPPTVSFLNTESKESTSSSSINLLTGCANQPMIEALDDEPLLHAVIGACRDIILQALPCLDNGFFHELLKGRDLVLKGIGLA